MAVILLPSLLAAEAGGQSFESHAETVEQALRELPVENLLFDERGELRGLVNIYVDGVDMRERGGLSAPLGEIETVRVVAAIAGG